jgi:hypothetical protein
LSGKFFAIGVETTEIVNEYLVSDYDQKATNNISRTLRSKNMQSQAWLLTKKLTARQKAFGVKENWQTYWTEIFGEPAPILENDKQNGFGN